jgi:Domain of unknown function (DUF4170)
MPASMNASMTASPRSPAFPTKQQDTANQMLFLVFGGELTALEGTSFKDVRTLDLVGVYPDYPNAKAAWKSRAQATVDNALMRYFVVPLHTLMPTNPS